MYSHQFYIAFVQSFKILQSETPPTMANSNSNSTLLGLIKTSTPQMVSQVQNAKFYQIRNTFKKTRPSEERAWTQKTISLIKLCQIFLLVWMLATPIKIVECLKEDERKKQPETLNKAVSTSRRFLKIQQILPLTSNTTVQSPPNIQPPFFLSTEWPPKLSKENQQFLFREMVDKGSFLDTLMFEKIRDYFISQNNQVFLQGQMRSVLYQNQTCLDYVTVYLIFDIFTSNNTEQHWIFNVFYKNVTKVEPVKKFKVSDPQKSIIKLTDINRDAIIQKLSPILRQQIDFIKHHPVYHVQAKLLSIKMLNYDDPITSKPTNEVIYRYYYPVSLGLDYEFVSFHYLTHDHKPPIDLDRVVVTKPEKFNPIGSNDKDLADIVKFFVNLYILPPGGIKNVQDYSVTNISESAQRQGVYRLFVHGGGKVLDYEINTAKSDDHTLLGINGRI